ncbi:hypothetical protein SCB49_10997 [unidentified eubacterium SCB49]|nr:hypothetical protein SCB49_10997 [unidentified eubacterium SCB49]
MKNITCLIVIFFSVVLNAQEYTPMLAEVNEWHFTTCYEGVCNEDVYYTDGTMKVEGNLYKVLDGYHYISREFLLREDLANKQVYLATIIGGVFREYLLYDFSLEIGEEFEMINPVSPFPENGGMFTLIETEMLELADGNLYKHFYFSPSLGNTISTWDAVWVEGLGSLSLPNAPGGNPSTNSAGRVSCAFRNGNSFYADFDIVEDCTPTILDVGEVFTNTNFLIINEQDKLSIKSSKEIIEYQLFDLGGKEILYKDVKQLFETSVDTAHLKQGVYFLKVKGESFVKVKKVIVY